jgi:hypothetical protein
MFIIAGIIAIGILSTLSLCRAAGRADRWMEEIQEKDIDELCNKK